MDQRPKCPDVKGLSCRVAAGLLAFGVVPALAQGNLVAGLRSIPDNSGVAGLSVVLALVLITTVTALLHMTGRKRWLAQEASLVKDLAAARARLDRANMFLASEKQIIIAWGNQDGQPDIEGDLSLVTDSPVPRRVLGFGSWLPPETAQQLERCVERLRERGEAFRLAIVSLSGHCLEVDGRAVGGKAVMRIRDVSGDRLELTRLRERHGKSLVEAEVLHALLDAIPNQVWTRDTSGRLAFVNAAYARAVDAKAASAAVSEGTELLDRTAREAVARARDKHEMWRNRITATVMGQRRMMEVIDVPCASGSAGMATDLSELDAMRGDLERQVQSHKVTLDQLSTAVAIFDQSKRLVFYNSAYQQLWSLDPAMLEQHPTDNQILDHLRAGHRLPEQADFRSWKHSLLKAYQALGSEEQTWHLPDRRALRVVITPNPQGGVTYLYDDISKGFDLETRYNGLVSVQGETLDTLKEGVAVFGADGCLKLFNPAFAKLWHLDPADLGRIANVKPDEKIHIDRVASLCAPLEKDGEIWSQIRPVVVGLHDIRTGFERKVERNDGTFVNSAVAPLPDGATLLTFTDITASKNLERAMTERHHTMVEAEQLRNDFVHHVSYELRSPLTNIIGFTQLLNDGSVGPLNVKQLEYSGYVMKSSAALLAMINDILDLATIDEDAMELSLADIDIPETMNAAAAGVQDRLIEREVHLQIVALDGLGTMQADGKRVRQILFNLLSNAIGFSAAGQTVTLAAIRRGEEIVFKVTDQGRGIPQDVIAKVYDRFHSSTSGSRHRGVGLGLSIVRALVELHGGSIDIQSVTGQGTMVTCILPAIAMAAARSGTSAG